jgi:hypothetical protein
MTSTKILHAILIVLINAIGVSFLALIFIGAPNINEEATNHVSENRTLFNAGLYVLAVSLGFSLLSILVSLLFKKVLNLKKRYLWYLFFFELFFFIIIFLLILWVVTKFQF